MWSISENESLQFSVCLYFYCRFEDVEDLDTIIRSNAGTFYACTMTGHVFETSYVVFVSLFSII